MSSESGESRGPLIAIVLALAGMALAVIVGYWVWTGRDQLPNNDQPGGAGTNNSDDVQASVSARATGGTQQGMELHNDGVMMVQQGSGTSSNGASSTPAGNGTSGSGSKESSTTGTSKEGAGKEGAGKDVPEDDIPIIKVTDGVSTGEKATGTGTSGTAEASKPATTGEAGSKTPTVEVTGIGPTGSSQQQPQNQKEPAVPKAFEKDTSRNLNPGEHAYSSRTATDKDLEAIKDVPKVIALTLDGSSSLTSKGLEALKFHAKDLRELSVAGCTALDDKISTTLRDLEQLEELNLSKTDIRETFLDNMSAANKIETLNLSGCFLLVDDAMNYVSRLPRLRTLDLSDCQGLTRTGILKLSALTSLDTLILRDNRGLTDDDITAIQNALPRTTITR